MSQVVFFNQTMDRKIATNIMWAYHTVGLIWAVIFILGCQSMTIAGSVAKWYFTRLINIFLFYFFQRFR